MLKGEGKMHTEHLRKTTITSFVAALFALTLMIAMIPFAFAPDVHNLAIVSVEPALTVVALGGSVNVTVTIENQGTVPMNQTTQLQFFYRAYENGTEGTGDDDPWGSWFAQIGYVAILNAGENASYTATWNVPSWVTPGDYQIRAAFPYAWVDDDPSDDTLLSDKVTVPVPGDINNDGIVDIMDVLIASLAFGSRPGDPNWNPEADLVNDGLIDIMDLVTIGVNFGRTA